MDLKKYVSYEHGKIVIDLAAVVKPAIEAYKAKIENGEVDLVKGTDLDKEVLVKALNALLAQV